MPPTRRGFSSRGIVVGAVVDVASENHLVAVGDGGSAPFFGGLSTTGMFQVR